MVTCRGSASRIVGVSADAAMARGVSARAGMRAAAAARPRASVTTTLRIAARQRPPSMSSTVSTVHVLNVVSPPQKPVTRMRRRSPSSAARSARPISAPATPDPTTFTMRMPPGRCPGRTGQRPRERVAEHRADGAGHEHGDHDEGSQRAGHSVSPASVISVGIGRCAMSEPIRRPAAASPRPPTTEPRRYSAPSHHSPSRESSEQRRHHRRQGRERPDHARAETGLEPRRRAGAGPESADEPAEREGADEVDDERLDGQLAVGVREREVAGEAESGADEAADGDGEVGEHSSRLRPGGRELDDPVVGVQRVAGRDLEVGLAAAA